MAQERAPWVISYCSLTTITAANTVASIRLGSTAPDFETQTSTGPIKFHDFIGNNWVVLFSHPVSDLWQSMINSEAHLQLRKR